MRPGLGDPFDAERVKKIWKLYKPGVTFPKKPQVQLEWWIFWRRMAAGLKPGHQRQILQDLNGILFPKGQNKAKVSLHELVEIWSLVGNMEYLSEADKVRSAKRILADLSLNRSPDRMIWVLSRLGSRDLLYGPADKVIASEIATKWVAALLAPKWQKVEGLGASLLRMSRLTGDRVRDLPEDLRAKVKPVLLGLGMGEKAGQLDEVRCRDAVEEKAMFGESLPSGIQLRTDVACAVEPQGS